MKNKKTTMFVASILIVIFHVWVRMIDRTSPIYPIGTFLRHVGFIGVDMFFFVSAFSIATRKELKYKSFVLSRFKYIYLKFAVFALVAFLYESWKPVRLIKVLTAQELFNKGGGSFLWFLPAIMIMYILLPFFRMADKKNPKLTAALAVVIWIAVGVLVTYLTKYKACFIFYNRIPIILLGYYFGKYSVLDSLRKNVKMYWVLTAILVVGGLLLVYNFGYQGSPNKPIRELFYVIGVPLTVGVVMLLDMIPAGKIVQLVGGCTLEMYALQMIFGFKGANKVYTLTKSPVITNIVSMVAIMAAAVVVSKLFSLILNRKRNA